MAATNKTPTIELSQWLPDDVLDWNELSEDNLKIDGALSNVWSRTDLKAESGTADVKLYNDSGIGYTLRRSRYWITGNLCTVQFNFMFDGTVPSPAINVRLDNLPVLPAADNTPSYHNPISLGALKSGYGRSPQAGVARQYNTFFNIMASNDISRYLQQVTTDWLANETSVSGTITYLI